VERVLLSCLILLIFLLTILPGAVAAWLYFDVIIQRNLVSGWEGVVLDTLIPRLTSIPGSVASLLAAVFPVAVMRGCYTATNPPLLNIAGKTSILVLLCGALGSAMGFFLIDPSDQSQIDALATAPKLAALKGLCEKALYLQVFYLTTFFGLRPKS